MSTKAHARRTTRSAIALYLAVTLGVSVAFVAAATPAGAAPVTVVSGSTYTSTGLTVSAGDVVTLSYVGGLISVGSDSRFQNLTPAGNLSETTGTNGIGCFPDFPRRDTRISRRRRALLGVIYRIGGGTPHYIGTTPSFHAKQSARSSWESTTTRWATTAGIGASRSR